MKNRGLLLETSIEPLDPLDRAARVADLADRLGTCLDELDRLRLWDVGAHLSMAVDTLERHANPVQSSRL